MCSTRSLALPQVQLGLSGRTRYTVPLRDALITFAALSHAVRSCLVSSDGAASPLVRSAQRAESTRIGCIVS